MLVKICGITRQQDADAAVAEGAGAIGFVFWPRSPRCIDREAARRIVDTLPALVTSVGVFVNQPVDEVNAIAREVGLGAVQLHGDETPEYVERIERPVLKSVVVGSGPSGSSAAAVAADGWPLNVRLLLDVHDPVQRGGTGQVIDWDLSAAIAARRPVLLAGGLRPDNVGAAIRRVQPFGIDVSSGVESGPGIKDHERLRALFAALRSPSEVAS